MIFAHRPRAIQRLTEVGLGTLDALAVETRGAFVSLSSRAGDLSIQRMRQRMNSWGTSSQGKMWRTFFTLFIVPIALGVLALLLAFPAEADPLKDPAPPPAQGKKATEVLEVKFEKGRLTAEFQNVALEKALPEIAKKSGIEIALDETIKDKRVTAKILNEDLERALDRLIDLAGLKSYSVVYRPGPKAGRIGSWVIQRLQLYSGTAGPSTPSSGAPPSGAPAATPGEPSGPPQAAATSPPPSTPPIEKEPYFDEKSGRWLDVVRGEVTIKFALAITPQAAEQIIKNLSGSVISLRENVYRIKIPEGQTVSEAQRAYRGQSGVIVAEPNFIMRSMAITPNDPLFGSQWALQKIEGPKAWEVTTGSPDVIVAVIDTGIDSIHPDLRAEGKVLPGYNVLQPDRKPMDDNGHGTAMAGVIAAGTNDDTGMAGVCWTCTLMPVKVLNAWGEGTYSDVIEGIGYAVDHGARVLNLGFGGYAYSQLLRDAIDYAHAAGAVLVAAGGNEATSDPIYPAAFPDVIGVSATDSSARIWAESNSGYYIRLSAPGVDVLTAALAEGYSTSTGTSLAAAHVSGLGALVLSKNSNLAPTQIEQILYHSSDDLGEKGKDRIYGYGRVNAAKSLEAASVEVHDVAVSRIRLEPKTIDVGGTTRIILTVQNMGTFAENNIAASVSANNVPVDGTKEIKLLMPGQRIDVHFAWHPSGEAEGIIIRAEVVSVPGETKVHNNTKTARIQIVHESGHVIIKYVESVHQYLGQVAFNKLPEGSPVGNEIIQGGYLGREGNYSRCNPEADSGSTILEGLYEEDDGPEGSIWPPPHRILHGSRK